MTPLSPIFITDLFYKIDKKLIEVLQSLSDDDWNKQSIAPLWTVKDIAVHLLDGNIRSLSMARDGYYGVQPDNVNTYQDLVFYLNKLNADWVIAFKRMSPKILVELLEISGRQYCEYITQLNPFDKAIFPVNWAGEEESRTWFHVAREYTEKWHHQQQIRLAVGKEGELYAKEFYWPHLETSMRALPHHYRTLTGDEGDTIQFVVTGEGGGTWNLYHENSQWFLVQENVTEPICKVIIEGAIAWRLLTKGISKQEARNYISIEGKQEAGEMIFDMLAVMA
ncbi:maleylpyruvate isomerase N-terminal domain-containing protein [Emticicia sp. BO119]|uniref:maleylpyruvate isomerase N-terminal domain-containing protein n=1 Tax=Emticicia sp. BO119 TaxID=2757768 RepID=UPI0015F0DC17|nr:maleylpyruvate isomerase N-terminal domain-containing protein [Emticicia sp. BO119]MBA4849621.1 maleylpyruvate isomerase N-terminal domain-containing protein [Emticicia sp. BO119]